MHHTVKKSAVKQYSHLASKVTDLNEALKKDDHGFSEEEITEIMDEIFAQNDNKKDEEFITSDGSARKLYDKWRGQWQPAKLWRNPVSKKDEVIQWKFERMGTKPNKTGIPMSENQAKFFNESRHLDSTGVPTEQLFPAGSTTEIRYTTFDPNEIVNV